jgi:adenosine deaminase
VQVSDDDEADFGVFMGKFNVLRQFYRSLDIIRRITREAVEDAAGDQIRYMELRFTPHALARVNNHSYEDVIRCVCEEADRAQADFGIQVKLIVSFNRHESILIANRVLDAALLFNGEKNIVGIDLAGLEVGHPARPFQTLFEQAKKAGLHLTVHAGEWEGAANVRDAIVDMKAERIGHGVRVIEDSTVIQLVRERHVTLEVCPTSNLHTGVVHYLHHHPLGDLLYLGLPVTINTDDPSLSNITLTDELVLAHVGLGLPLDMLKTATLNAAQAAFLPEPERAALVAEIQTALDAASMP